MFPSIKNFVCSAIVATATVVAQSSVASILMTPTSAPDLVYDTPILNHTYSDNVTRPEDVLGFEVGQRVATPAQISELLSRWSTESARLQIVEYARTHEGRPLFSVFISTPENLAELEQIKAKIGRLTDARAVKEQEAKAIIDELPAIAWMAYSIHGNETSGADSAIASIYHLIASTDPSVTDMLKNMVVIIDPMMNPDGRARFAKSLEQYRGTAPNVDDQSLLHTGDWPYGRTNHYFFDLNRDFYFLTQPETRGRVAMINSWRPQLMIDGHEMDSQDTFLMGPPRQPLNTNIDTDLQRWGRVFSEEQGAAFDARGWRYYTGEWFENLYPGYSNYAEYRGSVHILYEQSRMAEDGVRRPEGTVQTYQESVHHQFESTMVNLQTLAKHSKAMYRDYWDGRKYNVAKNSPFADRSYVVLANENQGRMNALAEVLRAQGIELFTNPDAIKVGATTLQSGEQLKSFEVPAGSMIIPNRQPEAPLIAAIMEFDASISDAVLTEEREKVLREGASIMYDTTAWNLTMMYGLPAVTVSTELSQQLTPWRAPSVTLALDADANAWWVNGIDDRSVAFAARLLEQDIQVRVIDRATEFSGRALPRGSVFVTAMDNPNRTDLPAKITEQASLLNLDVGSTQSGYGPGDLPDWGGEHFRLLTKPQIAILSQAGFSSYDVGVSWWSIDQFLGIRHSQLDAGYINRADLRRYNTIVAPNGYRDLGAAEMNALREWVKQGGTLIAHDGSAATLATEGGIGTVRGIQDSLEKAQEYDLALQRQRLSQTVNIDTSAVNARTVNAELSYPWDPELELPSKEELKKRDEWQRLFMPSGAIVAGRTDTKHWLTFGTEETLPLLYGKQPVLMTNGAAEAVVRVGTFTANDAVEAKRILNWSTLPEGEDLQVRMSGLLWPEAASRIANSAYLTRERLGNGQVILFSGQPNFRGGARGTLRLWLNALIYGPGLGAEPSIDL